MGAPGRQFRWLARAGPCESKHTRSNKEEELEMKIKTKIRGGGTIPVVKSGGRGCA